MQHGATCQHGQGVQPTVSDVEGGVVLDFLTGDPARVADLREHVRELVEQIDGGATAMHGGHGMHGLRAQLPPARATSEELPNGARLLLKPIDPTQYEALRAQVREQLPHLSCHCTG